MYNARAGVQWGAGEAGVGGVENSTLSLRRFQCSEYIESSNNLNPSITVRTTRVHQQSPSENVFDVFMYYAKYV